VFVSDLAFSTADLGRSALARLPRLSTTGVKAQEGDRGIKNLDYWVTMSRPSTVSVSVYVETSGDLGASVGEISRQLVFKPGQTRQKVTVPVTGNTRDSYDLKFSLVLSAPKQAILDRSFGQSLVVDDDPTPTLTIGPGTATENARFLKFPIKLSAPSDQFVSVSGVLQDGTAVLRKDYTSEYDDGTANPPDSGFYSYIEPGRTTGDIVVKLIDDKLKEPTETFTAQVQQVDGALLRLPLALTGTIRDND
jgi:hypothetical protein